MTDHVARTRILLRARIYLSLLVIGVASVFHQAEWLIFVGLVPLLYSVRDIRNMTKRNVQIDMYLGSVLAFSLSSLFLLQMAPKNWSVVLQGRFALVSRIIAWLLIVGVCSLAFWIAGALLWRIEDSKKRLLAFPVIWLFAEVLRAFLYSVVAYGPGGHLGLNYNFGALAVMAAGTPLVYLSRFIGFYGLTLGVTLINIAIYAVFHRRQKLSFMILAGIVLLTYVGWRMGEQKQGKTINVALVHLNERDSLDIWDGLPWPTQGADLMVLPEYSEVYQNADFTKIAARLSQTGIGVSSQKISFSPDATNQLQYFDYRGNIVSKQDKSFLIATGEYVPYSLQAAFWAMGEDDVMREFNLSQKLDAGHIEEHPYRGASLQVGALACSGVTSLTEYRDMTQKGADVLVNSASLAFLQNKSMYHTYARNMARFHAVSNNRPFVQASRSGQSFILDAQGKTLIEYTKDESSLMEYRLTF